MGQPSLTPATQLPTPFLDNEAPAPSLNLDPIPPQPPKPPAVTYVPYLLMASVVLLTVGLLFVFYRKPRK